MAAPMILRRAKWHFTLTLAKLLIGKKATAAHFALVGAGSSLALTQRLTDAGYRKVLVVTDAPLRALGLIDPIVDSLTSEGVEVEIFDGVEPDPTYSQIKAGAAIKLSTGCDVVLAIGGGSSMDAAKIIACCKSPTDTPESWVGRNKVPEEITPLYAIPTTAGTGSEATMGAVITNEADHCKQVIAAPDLLPSAVALDAGLMLGLPGSITAATGIDALTHGIEAYLSVWDRGTRAETGRLAITGVFQWLRKAMETPENLEARQGMAIAAYYGGVAINQVNVGTVHAIAHQLGATYGIPHGVANGLVLPHVLRLYGEAATDRLAQLAAATGVASEGSAEARSEAFIAAIEALKRDVGLPEKHPAIQRADHLAIAEAAVAEGDGYFSPRLFTVEQVCGILEAITESGS